MDPRYKSPESHVQEIESAEFRDLSRHTTILAWLLRLGALLAVLAVWSNWMQLDLLGRQYTLEEAQANDLRMRAIAMSVVVVLLATFIVFGRWIVVAHRNLPALGAEDLDVQPGWAVGWFFIPFANLWKPYQAMRTLWKASHDGPRWQYGDGHLLLGLWWTLWIVSSVLGSAFFRTTMNATTIPQLIDATRAVLINSLVDIPQYIVAWLLVKAIWKAQMSQRQRQLAGDRATDLRDFSAVG
jgi:hypothetical protein